VDRDTITTMVNVGLIGSCLIGALGIALLFAGQPAKGGLIVGICGALALVNLAFRLVLVRQDRAVPARRAATVAHGDRRSGWFHSVDDRFWRALTSKKGKRVIIVFTILMFVALGVARAAGNR
jgi:hypothetical protein